jgi:hypothetical protein
VVAALIKTNPGGLFVADVKGRVVGAVTRHMTAGAATSTARGLA